MGAHEAMVRIIHRAQAVMHDETPLLVGLLLVDIIGLVALRFKMVVDKGGRPALRTNDRQPCGSMRTTSEWVLTILRSRFSSCSAAQSSRASKTWFNHWDLGSATGVNSLSDIVEDSEKGLRDSEESRAASVARYQRRSLAWGLRLWRGYGLNSHVIP